MSSLCRPQSECLYRQQTAHVPVSHPVSTVFQMACLDRRVFLAEVRRTPAAKGAPEVGSRYEVDGRPRSQLRGPPGRSALKMRSSLKSGFPRQFFSFLCFVVHGRPLLRFSLVLFLARLLAARSSSACFAPLSLSSPSLFVLRQQLLASHPWVVDDGVSHPTPCGTMFI